MLIFNEDAGMNVCKTLSKYLRYKPVFSTEAPQYPEQINVPKDAEISYLYFPTCETLGENGKVEVS